MLYWSIHHWFIVRNFLHNDSQKYHKSSGHESFVLASSSNAVEGVHPTAFEIRRTQSRIGSQQVEHGKESGSSHLSSVYHRNADLNISSQDSISCE